MRVLNLLNFFKSKIFLEKQEYFFVKSKCPGVK